MPCHHCRSHEQYRHSFLPDPGESTWRHITGGSTMWSKQWFFIYLSTTRREQRSSHDFHCIQLLQVDLLWSPNHAEGRPGSFNLTFSFGFATFVKRVPSGLRDNMALVKVGKCLLGHRHTKDNHTSWHKASTKKGPTWSRSSWKALMYPHKPTRLEPPIGIR